MPGHQALEMWLVQLTHAPSLTRQISDTQHNKFKKKKSILTYWQCVILTCWLYVANILHLWGKCLRWLSSIFQEPLESFQLLTWLTVYFSWTAVGLRNVCVMVQCPLKADGQGQAMSRQTRVASLTTGPQPTARSKVLWYEWLRRSWTRTQRQYLSLCLLFFTAREWSGYYY